MLITPTTRKLWRYIISMLTMTAIAQVFITFNLIGMASHWPVPNLYGYITCFIVAVGGGGVTMWKWLGP